ncbi:GFA family protein [Proteobacteria bacterium 005FR1]|nr:GFA family protein [Proteobacteria bacterium 005FR1]
MLLKGSCHCGAVRFELESRDPYPFSRCYCSVCRKTAGGGGYAINQGGDAATLKVDGVTAVYHALIDGEESPAERHFCSRCASCLWLYDRRWSELIHPFASAIDTDLPIPPEHIHLMLDSKAPWVEVEAGPRDRCFAEYPDESLAEWHERLGLGR